MGGLLLGGSFFRRFLIYACFALAAMFVGVGVPRQLLASGASTALFVTLILFASAMLGLLGAVSGLVGRTIVGLLMGNAHWIEDLSKSGKSVD
jgi:hypothetical protein